MKHACNDDKCISFERLLTQSGILWCRQPSSRIFNMADTNRK